MDQYEDELPSQPSPDTDEPRQVFFLPGLTDPEVYAKYVQAGYADGGEVLSHTAGYQPTNQETQDYQDAHSMPMLSALAEGGPVGPSARDMLQRFAEGGEVDAEEEYTPSEGVSYDLAMLTPGNGPSSKDLLQQFDSVGIYPEGMQQPSPQAPQQEPIIDLGALHSIKLASAPYQGPSPDVPMEPQKAKRVSAGKYKEAAVKIAEKYGLPADVFLALVNQESRFNPNAVSRAGAIGLTQLMPGTAKELRVNPNNPIQNLEGGARYLKQQLNRFGSMDLALAAYNAGPGAVSKYGKIPPFKETRKYVNAILTAAAAMRDMPTLSKPMKVAAKYAEGGEVAPQQGGAGAAWDLGISGDWNAPAVNLQPKKLAQVTPGLSASQIAARNRAASQAAIEQAFTKADLPMDSKLFYQWQQKLASGAVTPETLQEQFAPAANQRRVEQAYAAAGIGKDGTFAHPKNAGEMFKLYVNPNLTPTQMAEINQKYAKFGENWDLATADKMRQQILVPVLQAQDFYNRNPEARAAYAERLAKKPNADYVKFARSYLTSRDGMGGMGGQPGTGLTWDKSINVGSFRTPVTTTSAQDQSYWVNKLVSGELTPEQFQTEFQASLSTMRPSATGYQYRDQWSTAPLPAGMYYAEGGEVKKPEDSSGLKEHLLEGLMSAYRQIPAQNRIFFETAAMSPEERAKTPITEAEYTDSERKRLLDTIINARARRTKQLNMNDPEGMTKTERSEAEKALMPWKLKMDPKELERVVQKERDVRKSFKSGKGAVFYEDYPGYDKEESATDSSMGPSGAIRNSLGRFTYETLPDGRIRVMDRNYDFADDLVKELGQRPSAEYEAMGPAKKAWTLIKDTIANPKDEDSGGFRVGAFSSRSRLGSALIGRRGRPVDITIDPREIMPGYAGYAHGGEVRHRAEGSPATGEVKAIPDKYPLVGAAGRGLEAAYDFLSAPFGYENPPARALLDLVEAQKIARGLQDVSQGLPLTRGSGMATYPTENAKAMLGAVVGATPAKNVAVKGGKEVVKAAAPRVKQGLEKAMELGGTAPAYAVKPKGGMFYPEGSNSKLDLYLDKLGEQFGQGAEGTDEALKEFVRTKGRQYFTNTYGSNDDAVRKAIMEGKLTLFGKDTELFPDYLLEGAKTKKKATTDIEFLRQKLAEELQRTGEIPSAQMLESFMSKARKTRDVPPSNTALRDLTRQYDRQTSLSAITRSVPEERETGTLNARLNQLREREKQKMRDEGTPDEFINYGMPIAKTAEEMSTGFSSDAQKMLSALLKGERSPVTKEEEALLYGAKRGQPVYDLNYYPNLSTGMAVFEPRLVAESLRTIPAKDLAKMSFEDALIKGTQNLKLERNWDTVVHMAANKKTLPRDVYLTGTSPIEDLGKGRQLVKLDTLNAAELEGNAMGHSVKDYKYKEVYGVGGRQGFLDGRAQVFSVRAENGKPLVTLEAERIGQKLVIKQIKGPYNSYPTEQEVQDVLKSLSTLRPAGFRLYSNDSINTPGVERYTKSRQNTMLDRDEQKLIDWGQLYNDYMASKSAGGE